MIEQKNYHPMSCRDCTSGSGLDFDFTMAFQPIVNVNTREIFAHEALVRGMAEEPAGQVLSRVNEDNRYRFDQACRVKAISVAAQLGMTTALSINFLPNAVYRPDLCIRTTIEASEQFGFPVDRIIFEITEGEKVKDHGHLREIIQHYKSRGFRTAIDDFGAGYSGLNLLAEFQTDLVKLDMALIRDIDQNRSRRAIVRATIQMCHDLGIEPVAEGIERYDEMRVLQDFGVALFQGYHFAKPAFRGLAKLNAGCFDAPA